MEKEVVDIQAATTEATQRLAKEEETRERTVIQHFEETESLRSQNMELQTLAHQHLHMWKNSEEQRTRLSDSYNHLQVEALVDIERQRDILMKESDDRGAKLNRNYEQELQILTAAINSLHSTCEHIIRQREQEAQAVREELEICRAQIGMDETRIKVLIVMHR